MEPVRIILEVFFEPDELGHVATEKGRLLELITRNRKNKNPPHIATNSGASVRLAYDRSRDLIVTVIARSRLTLAAKRG
jgi:hypothetical protein